MTAGESNHGGGPGTGDGARDLVGRTVAGRYRITALVGRGGMGVVARATDETLHREVAVKILRAHTDASGPELAELRARMEREARAAARIRHSGVVTVHDVVEDRGLPVIVMELVDGPSLEEVLTRRGPLDPYQAAEMGARLMDALDAAHRAGVLHRDVKPGNVLLERAGRVVLTDFGIASVEDVGAGVPGGGVDGGPGGGADAGRLTRSGEIVGSLDYLPPERAQGREPGPASDIWALGMTLYAAVEGAAPFRRTSVWSTLTAIVTEPLPEPRRAGPLAPVLRALMAKDPAACPSADAARALLEKVAAARPAPAPAAPAPGFPVLHPTQPPSQPQPAAVPQDPPPQPAAEPAAVSPEPPRTADPAPVPPPVPAPAPAYAEGRTEPIAVRRRSRSRWGIVAAAVAAVLVAGGLSYGLAGGHGGADGGQARAAAGGQPPTTPAGSGQQRGDGLNGTAGPDGSSLAAGGGTRRTPSGPPSPSTGGTGGTATSPAGPGPGTPGPTTAAPPPPASGTTPPSPRPTTTPTVSRSCGGWSHRDPNPGTYGYMTGNYHIETGPYASCPDVALVPSGKKVWYHCYVLNAYGHTWWYLRISGTDTAGWMSADNLRGQTGPSTRC